MKTAQFQWSESEGWPQDQLQSMAGADLVLVFGGRDLLEAGAAIDGLQAAFPEAHVVGCSTAGEIFDIEVHDDAVVATAIQFDDTRVTSARVDLDSVGGDSRDAGEALAALLDHNDLKHVFLLSDGLAVNGTQLVSGLSQGLPGEVSVSGGLSGDGDRFERTVVVDGDEIGPGKISAIGLHGSKIRVGSASLGGWDPFGPERKVTRAEGNVLFELDEQPALELYKTYLGEHADGLPATGLLFPIAVRVGNEDHPLVRTILAIDEGAGSLTFAGDVPEGAYARLMRANFDRLVEGAAGAAASSDQALNGSAPELAILISCVGRKLLLKQRIEDEVEAVRDVLGDGPALTGFYSYGEISPFTHGERCELHNQTMTITTLSER